MYRKIILSALACAAVAPFSHAAAQQPPEKPPVAPAVAATAAGKPAQETAAERHETMVTNTTAKIWWNQEAKVRELQLSAAQRQSFDRLLRDFLLAESAPAVESYDQMGAKLALGDAAAARKALDEAIQAIEAPVRRQGELMISVVGQLTAAQRKILDQNYPQLLRRPWVRAFRNQRRAATPARANAPQN